MTGASQRALVGLRDPATMQWYAIPLLAIVFYIYVIEIKKARQSRTRSAPPCPALRSIRRRIGPVFLEATAAFGQNTP